MLISKTKTEQKRNDGSSTSVLFKRLARCVKQQTPEKRQCDDGQWYTKKQRPKTSKMKPEEDELVIPDMSGF